MPFFVEMGIKVTNLRAILARGNDGDGPALLESCQADYVIADTSYDSDDLIALILSKGAIPVIPSRKNRS